MRNSTIASACEPYSRSAGCDLSTADSLVLAAQAADHAIRVQHEVYVLLPLQVPLRLQADAAFSPNSRIAFDERRIRIEGWRCFRAEG